MRKYVQAYQDAFGTGLVKDVTIKQHIAQQAIIDKLLPDSASFFYIVETPSQKLLMQRRLFDCRINIIKSDYIAEQ